MTSTALVLGGGGPVGIAWETGLLVSLAEAGVDLASVGRVIGTSAGSVVGAHLALGDDLAERGRRFAEQSAARTGGAPYPESLASRMGQLVELIAQAAVAEDAQLARANLGHFALESDTAPEERFVEGFDELAGRPWPAPFACTAVDALTGEFVVWDQTSGIDLELGVASSCSVPGVFPPITINGRRYIDGGMRSALNADLAVDADATLVVTVTALNLPVIDPRFARMQERRNAEIEALRGAGRDVAVIEPDANFREISGMGMFLMDASRVPSAYDAGLLQGANEATRVGEWWRRATAV
jgi:NTE family protein